MIGHFIAIGLLLLIYTWIKLYITFFEIEGRLSILELDLEILNIEKKIKTTNLE